MAAQAQLPATWARIGPEIRKPEPMIEAKGVTVARHNGARSSFGRNVTIAVTTATGTIRRLGEIIRELGADLLQADLALMKEEPKRANIRDNNDARED